MLPFILLTVVALAVVLYTEWRGASNERAPIGPLQIAGGVAKTAASAGFLGSAIAAGALGSFYGTTLFIALAWCFVGDVLLIGKARMVFMLGIAAFLMGHLGYVMVFRMLGYDSTLMLVSALVLAGVGWLIWNWLSPHVKGGMRYAVGAYIAVITLMVAFAIGTLSPLGIAAATLFWLSDLCVARQRFVTPSFWNRAVGLPLYYAAQHLFVLLLPG